MADILMHSTVPSHFTQTESASNLMIDTPTKDSQTTNKYNGHVTRLRNAFTEHSLTPIESPKTKEMFQTLNNNNRQENPLQLTDISLNRTHKDDVSYAIVNRKSLNSEQHYDFPADAIEQFKKQQRDEKEQMTTHIIPSLLPFNVVKRMNHLNTIFVKPTKIERALPKLVFQDDEKQVENPILSETSYVSDDNRSSSPLFYEKSGIPELNDDDENDDDSLNDTRRVRFSNKPIRVYPTYSPDEYDRRNDDIDPYSASAEYELEKRIEKMDVFNVEIERGPDGLGISVLGMGVGADSGLEKLGIFVKTLNPEGVIAKDGRIQIGDQIIEVNDHSLVGVTHLYATNVLKTTSGLVKFVIGREKDFGKSEILSLIQRSLQLDQEREEMSQTFQQYHDAYYEQNFNDDDEEDLSKDDQQNAQKMPNEYQIEILKQCYESLEKTLENTEKEKEDYQQLYQQSQNDFKEIEEKYLQAKILIKELQDQEIESNEQHEKYTKELLKRIEELEKVISLKSSESITNRTRTNSGQQVVSTGRNLIKTTLRLPSISLDKILTCSQQDLESEQIESNIPQQNLDLSTSNNNKSTDENSLIVNKKHLSTPSLGEISTDSEIISAKIRVTSLEKPNPNEYIEIKDWTLDQCIQWLTAQQMTSLIPIFLNRNINGEKLLLLDSAKMKAMGIKSSKDRDQLKSKIKELKHAELDRLREGFLHPPSSVYNGKRLRSSSLTKLRERRFFSSSSGK